MRLFVLGLALLTTSVLAKENKTQTERQGKVFSLFNVITFQNVPCRSNSAISSGATTSSFRNGTCFTAAECSNKGGSAAGVCASGFGVCCVFSVFATGSTITQNNTYLRNPGFPTPYTSTSSLTYTVQKCNPSICYLRLDFETFSILGTGRTDEATSPVVASNTGGLCQDFFTVTTTAGYTIPTICGQNAGQHMYIDLGALGSDSANLNFQFASGTTATNRQWDIKVSQIPCGSRYTPPEGCLQWYYGSLTGRFTTFNWIDGDNHLRNQDYRACVRQEEGYCCVQYSVCNEPLAFSLSQGAIAPTPTAYKAMQDSLCTSIDFISIPQSSATCGTTNQAGDLTSKYCFILNPQTKAMNNVPICSCTEPYTIGVFTDNLNDKGLAAANVAPSKGVCLNFQQIPCGRSN